MAHSTPAQTFGATVFIVGGAFVAGAATSSVSGGIIFVLILIGLCVVHESGHYLAAKVVGFEVVGAQLGVGPRVLTWTPREHRFDLFAVPVGGSVFVRARGRRGMRTRLALFALAGVGAEVATTAVLAGTASRRVYTIAFCVLALHLENLVPRQISRPTEKSDSDGRRFAQAMFGPRSGVDRWFVKGDVSRAAQSLGRRDVLAARAIADELMTTFPRDTAAQMLDVLVNAELDPLRARDRLAHIAAPATDAPDANIYAWACSTVASHLLREATDLPSARKWASAAIARQPENAAIQYTYGWTLIEAGGVAEGLEFVEKAMQGATTPPVRASVHAVRAIGLARMGDAPAAAAALEDARALDPSCQLLPRAEQAIAGISTSS